MPLPGPPLERDHGVRRASTAKRTGCGILWIESHIDGSGVFVFVENLVPGLAASWCGIHRVPYSAQRDDRARPQKLSRDCSDSRSLCRLRANPSGQRSSRIFQRPPTSRRRPLRDVATDAGFAGSHVNDVGSDTATARLPIPGDPSLSKIGDQVFAPSVDFHTRHRSHRNSRCRVAGDSSGGKRFVRHDKGNRTVFHSSE